MTTPNHSDLFLDAESQRLYNALVDGRQTDEVVKSLRSLAECLSRDGATGEAVARVRLLAEALETGVVISRDDILAALDGGNRSDSW